MPRSVSEHEKKTRKTNSVDKHQQQRPGDVFSLDAVDVWRVSWRKARTMDIPNCSSFIKLPPDSFTRR